MQQKELNYIDTIMKSFRGILALVVLVAMSACQEKDLYISETNAGVEDLIVPADFPWKTSKDVALSIESSVETSVDVYRTSTCEDANLIATLAVPTEEPALLSVPMNVETLYARYQKVDGSYSQVPVALNSAVTRASDSRASLKLPEDAGRFVKKDGMYYYPSKEWGTLLFEDMWPEKGDYDFNDFAAWYKIQLYTERRNTVAVLVSVRLNALGGTFPYQLCLQMDKLKAEEIDGVESYKESDEPVMKTGTYKLETSGTDLAVFSFDWKGLKGSNGGQFYNTEKAYEMNEDDLKGNIVSFMVYLDEGKSTSNFNHESFNFFLRKTDGTEIHLMGYKPTKNFEAKYGEMESDYSNILSSDTYYRTNDGFVWGLKIPVGIAHAQESVDFLKAYKFFGEWVSSNGERHKNWYEEQAGKEYRIDIKKTK